MWHLLLQALTAPAFTAGDLKDATELAPVFMGVSQIVKFHPRFPEKHLVWVCPLIALVTGIVILAFTHASAMPIDNFRSVAKWFMAGIEAVGGYKLQAADGPIAQIPVIGPALAGKLFPPTSAVPGASTPVIPSTPIPPAIPPPPPH